MGKRILTSSRKEETLDDIIKKSGKMSAEEAIEFARKRGLLADGPIEAVDLDMKVSDEFLDALLHGGLFHDMLDSHSNKVISESEMRKYRGMTFNELIESGVFAERKNGAIYDPNNSYRQNGDAR